MATLHVSHTLDDLESDCRKIATTTKGRMAKVVKKNVRQGRQTAQQIARSKSGPHGLNYYKRITDEMLSPLAGEYGPTGDVVGNAVGAGWRSGGPPNTDLEKSLDIQGPRFQSDVAGQLDRLFWPR